MCYKTGSSIDLSLSLSSMVFSFFKKPRPPEGKMGARPAFIPPRVEATEVAGRVPSEGDLKPTVTGAGPFRQAEPSFAETRARSGGANSQEPSAFEFSETAPEFQIEGDVDPIDAEAEEAAMFYANGQDTAARQILEAATRTYRSGPGERLWLMLFDFFRLTGQKAPFEALEIEYTQAFEKSPPVWRDPVGRAAPLPKVVGTTILFKGDLNGDNTAGFEAARQASERNAHLRLDLSNIRTLDSPGCERLLALLQEARRGKREIELLGREHLSALVDCRILPGRADNRGCWLLELELFQLRGQLEAFEDLAINYAVTFEISPPSWEASRVIAAEPAPQELAAGDKPVAEAYVLKGDLKATRFNDLLAYAAANDPVVIDCATATRMDFLSAGALLNVLTAVKRTGRQIVFRHPNYLLAELFRVVGLKNVTQIVLPRS